MTALLRDCRGVSPLISSQTGTTLWMESQGGFVADVSFPLLRNGLDFILSSLEHLKDKPSERNLKYAVLHLSSGIELVFKERLRREHWTLVFEKPEDANKSAYESGDFKSVSTDDCLVRLASVCGIGLPERKRLALKRLKDKRNKAEHFSIVDTHDALTASAAEALVIVLDFIKAHLKPGDFDAEDAAHLGEIRGKLAEFRRFASDRMAEISKNLKAAKKAVAICVSCGMESSLLGDGAKCLFCGHRIRTAKKAADEFLSGVLGESPYESEKEGMPWPRRECPSCDSDAMVDCRESAVREMRYVCFSCGKAWKTEELDDCSRCGRAIMAGDDNICGDCYRHIADPGY